MSFNFYHIRTDDFPAHTGGGQGLVITRDNYEAYFVMYVDEELNASARKAVEQFIQQNPDLEEEMVMLQQSVLRAEEDIVFEPKELLYKGAGEQLQINEQNCEEYFVLYGDDELTNAEKDKVEQFVYHHPQYQATFELLQQVKLVPDKALGFPDKAYLYRTEEDENRVIAFPWWRLTAAAIAILVIGSLWYITSNTENHDVAVETPSTKSTKESKLPPQVISPAPADIKKAITNNDVAEAETPVLVNTTPNSKQSAEYIVDASQRKNISEPRNKQKPSYVQQESGQMVKKDPENTDNAFTPKMVKVAVNNATEVPTVKREIPGAAVAVHTAAFKPEDEPDQSSQYILNAPINKTPLRGFFRKVSRVVDKVTNPEENGKKGIRIANLEIALN